VEITDLFEDHPVEHALGLVFGGDVLDVDANSDYGAAFGPFHEDFGSPVTRRTTVLVLGDGRGNGNDPNLPAFEEITRRARRRSGYPPEPRLLVGPGRLRPSRLRRALQPRPRRARPHRPGVRGDGPARTSPPMHGAGRLGSVRGRIDHGIRPDERSATTSPAWIADDLVRPGPPRPRRLRAGLRVGGRVDRPDLEGVLPQHLAALATGGEPGGTIHGMAPVHERAAALALGAEVVELGCCFGSCRCGWPPTGTR
jgi:hypothetical protein